jgi:predicted dehydrogenase
MNWLVVGIGDVVLKRVFPALAAEPRSTLYGVVTRDAAKGGRYATKVWQNLDDALADPAIDAVYVATPVFLHRSQVLAALRAGKHVLCEKPFSLDHAGALEMVDASRKAGRLLAVAYFRRQYPKLIRARQLLAENAIGQVVLVSAACSEWFLFGDPKRAWLQEPGLAGSGPLYDIGSHRVDALNFLLGTPVRVEAQLSNVVRKMAVEDCATVLIEYESGARAILDARWNTRVVLDDFRLIGTEGEMDLSPLSGPRLVCAGREEMLPCHANRHYPCIENFVRAVLDGAPLGCSGADSLPTDWVLETAVQKGGR